jgi:hypothetical protein
LLFIYFIKNAKHCKMKKIIWLLVFVILSCPIFIQCHKNECKSEYLGDVRFTETDLKINPYKGTERLVFKDSIGDSICYDSGVRYSNYNLPIYEYFDLNNPEACRGDYYELERNYAQFNEVESTGFIKIVLNFDNPFIYHEKSINLQIDFGHNPSWYFNCEFDFDSLEIFESARHYPTGSILSYNDSIIIGPITCYSVYVLMQNSEPVNVENLKTVYYSINNGIVGFKTVQGHLWFLVK